jgi:tetratricopeptide (TPR) repeat protein
VAKDWLTTIGAGVCAVGMAVTSATASPAGMTLASRESVASQVPANVAAARIVPVNSEADRPTAQISPMRNPVKYFAAAVSEIPQVWKSKKKSSNVAAPSVAQNDSISLETPTGPPTPQLVISMAQMCERQGDIFQARRHFQQALQKWPGQVDVLRAAARMEDRQNELRLAETLYRQAVAANPQHAGALNDLGLCLARQGQLDPAIQVIEQAITLQPQKALYRNNAATILVEMRQDQRALAHLATVHVPAEANYNLGQLLVQRGRAADAAVYFQTALQYNPELQSAQMALGQLQGQPQVAPEAFVPNTGPVIGPQQPPTGPQLEYPATANTPDFGTSSYTLPLSRGRIGSLPNRPYAVPNQPVPMRR